MIEFSVKESEKTLWLYHEIAFSVKTIDYQERLCYNRADGKGEAQWRIWFDYKDKWHNFTYSHIVIEYSYGEQTYKYVGTADDILNRFSSYTKD